MTPVQAVLIGAAVLVVLIYGIAWAHLGVKRAVVVGTLVVAVLGSAIVGGTLLGYGLIAITQDWGAP